GALTPPEIAMSIVAEMTALRRGTDLSQALSSWEGSKTVCGGSGLTRAPLKL
ncbi:MAG: putative xanthine dehydrogenase subunit, partial [Pseudomonadota bacterium]